MATTASPADHQTGAGSGLVPPVDDNSALRHPLTVLVCLVPLGIIAECYRWLAGYRYQLLADEALTHVGQTVGVGRVAVTLVVLIIGCMVAMVIHRLPWRWPSLTTIGLVAGWSLVWALIRAVIGLTGDALLVDSTGGLDPLIRQPGLEMSLLEHIGLAITGAIQEELVFRAGLIGIVAYLLVPFRLTRAQARTILLLPAAILFALAHTDLINHSPAALPFGIAVVIQQTLAGLIYGIVFIRQGLAVCTMSHACYTGAVSFGLFDW